MKTLDNNPNGLIVTYLTCKSENTKTSQRLIDRGDAHTLRILATRNCNDKDVEFYDNVEPLSVISRVDKNAKLLRRREYKSRNKFAEELGKHDESRSRELSSKIREFSYWALTPREIEELRLTRTTTTCLRKLARPNEDADLIIDFMTFDLDAFTNERNKKSKKLGKQRKYNIIRRRIYNTYGF